MRKGFRKAITLESNQSRLTAEGALTAAAIGLMMMLVLQQQQTQASGGDEFQGDSRLNFDATRVPTGRIAVSQASMQDAARLRQASAYTPPNLGDVEIDDVKSANRTATANQKPGFALNETRIPYSSNASSTQGGSGLVGAENQASSNRSSSNGTNLIQTSQQPSQPTDPTEVPSVGALIGPGRGATGAPGTADLSNIQAGNADNALLEQPNIGAQIAPGRGATGAPGTFTGNPNTGGGGSAQIISPSESSASLDYRAFDGPMAGSTAYIDTNNNGFFDLNDWYTYTNEQGYFEINYIDSNENGKWEQTEAIKREDGNAYYLDQATNHQIKVIGGTDTISNSLNRHEITTSIKSTGGVVSPITTLIEGVSKDLELTTEEAEELVSTILGLESTLDLLTYDPFSISISNLRSNNEVDFALDYKIKAAQIYNLGYTTEVVTSAESFGGLKSLGKELVRTAIRSDGTFGTLDLTATDDLKTYFGGLSAVKISNGALDAFSSIAQQANSLIRDSGASSEILSILSSDRSIDGLGSNKLLNQGIDSSRDLLADILKKDESFSDGGAAKIFWSDLNVSDGSVAFEALHEFMGIPADIYSYSSLPQLELEADHNGETTAISAIGDVTISTYENVSLLKDAVLNYVNYKTQKTDESNFKIEEDKNTEPKSSTSIISSEAAQKEPSSKIEKSITQEKAAEIARDLSTQPASEFTGKPILLEAIHEHSINGQALDGAIEADISHQTRVLNRSTLLMGGQDDVLRIEATTDINISLFESMGVELHGEISSVAMEFSKLDMGGGDDIIEINSVLSLEIDSSEDIAKLIGDIDQEELGMLDSILMGGDGNDTMVVNGAVRSRIDGGEGNDDIYLTGESQFVNLDGGAGDDRIFGTKHSETLNGGDGDDLLFGLGGLDEMTGGRGSDIFIVDMDESVDLGNLNALSDFEKTLLSGKISNAELASITDFNGMEGDAIVLRGSSIGVTERAQDLFTYTPAASDMDKQVLLLSNFSEFFFSGQVELKEGYALLTDLDTLIQITDDGNLHALAHVSSQVTPSNGMVFTTNNSLSS